MSDPATTVTRQSADSGPGGLPSGYEIHDGTPELTIPSCGLEDVDKAIFTAFESGIELGVSADGAPSIRPKVVFAAGERWAVIKKRAPFRDSNGSLILPLITIVRTAIVQDTNRDITGRGINQQTGEIVLSRKFDKTDRGYQALINRFFLRNQKNAAVPSAHAGQGQLSTRNAVGELEFDRDIARGAYLGGNRRNNVYETITMPSPQFISVTYEVTFWTQYSMHMNQLVEGLITAELPQGNAFKLVTDKGYWFVATIDENAHAPKTNFEDMSTSERLLRHTFSVTVPAYIIAGVRPGAEAVLRRSVSMPSVSFTVGLPGDEASTKSATIDDPYLGADDPTLPLDTSTNPPRRDARLTGGGPLVPRSVIVPADPALAARRRGAGLAQYRRVRVTDPHSGQSVTENVRVRSANPSMGETVFSSSGTPEGLIITVIDE